MTSDPITDKIELCKSNAAKMAVDDNIKVS